MSFLTQTQSSECFGWMPAKLQAHRAARASLPHDDVKAPKTGCVHRVSGNPVVAHSGGCLCRSVRYALTSEPFDAGFCHCRTCQLASGAPVVAFATVPRADFVLIHGQPMRRRSSAVGERWFCGECGTPLAILVEYQPATLDFTIASLDDPNTFAPRFHIWHDTHIRWFETADNCPRPAGFRANTVGLPSK